MKFRHARPMAEVERTEWLKALADDIAFVLAALAIALFFILAAPPEAFG